MTFTSKCLCHKYYLQSPEGIFKMIELMIGLASWSLLYLGNVMATSDNPPQVNSETLLLSLTTLPCWIVTFSSFILFILCDHSKRSLKLDALMNSVFAVALGTATMVCSSSRDFIWLCVSDTGEVVDGGEFCDSPNKSVLRNGGQNLALVILTSILSTVYITHFILVMTQLCTKAYLPHENPGVYFFPVNT